MPFYRDKTTRKGTPMRQIVEAYRDDAGRPRQRVLAHLGPHLTLEAAIAACERRVAECRGRVERCETALRRRWERSRFSLRLWTACATRAEAKLERLRSVLPIAERMRQTSWLAAALTVRRYRTLLHRRPVAAPEPTGTNVLGVQCRMVLRVVDRGGMAVVERWKPAARAWVKGDGTLEDIDVLPPASPRLLEQLGVPPADW